LIAILNVSQESGKPMSITKSIVVLLALVLWVSSANAQIPATADPEQLGFSTDRLQRIDLAGCSVSTLR
jgi:hypothetical protein